MPDIETLPPPPITSQAENIAAPDARRLAAGAKMSALALHEEVARSLYAEASGPLRPEDDGRMYDIDAAHAAAIMEDAHREALIENEIFDAHTEALAEDKVRTEAKEEAKKQEEEKAEEPEVTAGTTAEAKGLEPDMTPQNRVQALLREAGHDTTLPIGSIIAPGDNPGETLVVSQHSVMVLSKSASGPHVSQYSFDREKNIVTISTDGQSASYAPSLITDELERAKRGEKSLPAAVARALGVNRVVPAES